MTDTVRCPSCRGAKKVAKLGGIVGECNTCKGKGTILAIDKPQPIAQVVEPVANNIIKAVADCVPTSLVDVYKDVSNAGTLEFKNDVVLPEEPQIKIDPKKALYKRKKA